ncbi:DUF6588 family protein [Flavobacterium limnosediminis]|uniref:DUF6588 family protein n=1 Tax=Flavobacterium limnosediminis TaxID=1401027 RepID=UPI001FE00C17|nr:DUF6588 family protein [Flavobacterium limnosediminis]
MPLTLRLMRKSFFSAGLFVAFLCFSNTVKAQSSQTFQDVENLLNDALFYSDQYITPATDAAVYQAASGWITSPKKRKLWDVTLGLHSNVFFVPKRDRSFEIKNSDFTFFQIEGATSATVPTALGDDSQVYLVGDLDGEQIRLKTPEGVNQETIFYPYLQGSIGLWYGTEFVAKFSPKTKLKKGDYQVYGFGLKHNFSQYFKNLEPRKIHLSALVAYSKEDISFDFITIPTQYGSLGINQLNGLVDTWQFQLNGSKEFKNFELMGGLIVNTSKFRYIVGGEKGEIEELIPLQDILNMKLEEISKTKTNVIGEISGRYQIKKVFLQPVIGFGKFVNTNFSIQYEF